MRLHLTFHRVFGQKFAYSFLDQLRSVCILKRVLLEKMLEITMAMNHVANKDKNIADLGAREM